MILYKNDIDTIVTYGICWYKLRVELSEDKKGIEKNLFICTLLEAIGFDKSRLGGTKLSTRLTNEVCILNSCLYFHVCSCQLDSRETYCEAII